MVYICDEHGDFYNPQKNRLVKVTDIAKATKLEKKVAEGYIQLLGKGQKYILVEEKDMEKKETKNSSETKKTKEKKKESETKEKKQEEEKTEEIKKEDTEPNWIHHMKQYSIWEHLKTMQFIGSHLKKYQEYLQERLSIEDRKTSDILHYIELYDMDEIQKTTLIADLAKIREIRRDIKNRLYECECFKRIYEIPNLTAQLPNELLAIKQFHTKFDNPYEAKALPDLFSNVKKKEQTDTKAEKDKQITELILSIQGTNYSLSQAHQFYKDLKDLLEEKEQTI